MATPLPLPDPGSRTPSAVAAYVLSVLASSADTPYIGEPISQLEHSLQAGHLATGAPSAGSPADAETQVAALLHDVGQFAPEADIAALLSSPSSSSSSSSGGRAGTSLAGGIQTMGATPAESVGRVGHETLGSLFLGALGFPEKVARLVGSHVAAKRYLCAVDAGYYDRLSDASKQSLAYQGGPMQGDEKIAFGSDPWCSDMCQLRQWDDAAKEIGLKVPGLESWRERIELVLKAN